MVVVAREAAVLVQSADGVNGRGGILLDLEFSGGSVAETLPGAARVVEYSVSRRAVAL